MKRLLLTLLFFGALCSATAQTPNYNNVRPVEFEAGMGLIQGLTCNGNRVALSGQMLTELRLNHTPTPFDVGWQLYDAQCKGEDYMFLIQNS